MEDGLSRRRAGDDNAVDRIAKRRNHTRSGRDRGFCACAVQKAVQVKLSCCPPGADDA